jgi:hypothetical protein
MRTERMVGAKFLELIFNEGGDPVGISLIDHPGKSDKGHYILFVSYLFDMEFLV